MTEFCLFGSWVLPVMIFAGGLVMSTMVGYGMWKFVVSPVKLQNQELSQLNERLMQELAETEQLQRFYLGSYSRERDGRRRIEERYSLLRERLEALEMEKKKDVPGPSSAIENLDNDVENAILDTLGGPGCPVENSILLSDQIIAMFYLFSWGWIVCTAVFLLFNFRVTKELFLATIVYCYDHYCICIGKTPEKKRNR